MEYGIEATLKNKADLASRTKDSLSSFTSPLQPPKKRIHSSEGDPHAHFSFPAPFQGRASFLFEDTPAQIKTTTCFLIAASPFY